MKDQKIWHLTIKGRVQGVSYRAWFAQKAGDLGLSGMVRNRHQGTVEAVLAGSPDALEQMLALCQNGPPLALVEDIDLAVLDDASDWALPASGVEIRPSV